MRPSKAFFATTSGMALLVVAVVCLNVIAGRLPVRLDVTHDRVYSLSPGSRAILAHLDRDATAKLYFSRSMKELPVAVKTYATRVEEVLREYAGASGGRLAVQVIDPKPDTDDEEWAQKYGLSGVRLPRGDQMFFGVVFVSGAKEVVIPYLDPRREEFLEYDLSAALLGTARKDTAKVGVLSSLPVSGGGPPGGEAAAGGEWAFLSELRRSFDVQLLSPTLAELAPELKAVLVLHPKGLADETLYALDQYVLGGGHLIVAVDPMSRTELALSGAQARAAGQMPQAASDLAPLLKAWGVDYDKDQLVGDAGSATAINVGGAVVQYPFFLTLRGDAAFSRASVITANLREMMLGEGGALRQAAGSAYQFEPLLKTTKDSGTASAALAAVMMPQDLTRELKPDGQERVLAALVRGKFKSAYPGGPPGGAKAPARTAQPLAEAAKEAQVLVIADVDFLADQNAAEKLRFGNQVMVRARNDNLSFVANAVDYFAGSDDLIAIRSRGRVNRPFTRVAALERAAQLKWQAEEETLTAELTDLQKKLNELQQQRTDGNRFTATAAQQGEITRFRDEERRIRSRRREVRKSLREDIEALGRRLLALNLLAVPLATSAFGAGVFIRRARHRGAAAQDGGSHG